MISIQQCRAARGLLGWTQQDLSEASGLSKTAINNFEKGHSDIKAESLKAIRMAFESAGIEFMGDDGLRRKTENIRVMKGETACADLLDDIYETLKDCGGEVLIGALHERTLARLPEATQRRHRDRLQTAGISERILSPQAIESAEDGTNRLLPADAGMTGMTTFIYGQKVAFELWEQAMIMIVNSREASDAERRRFEILWAGAPPATSKKRGATNSNATSLGRAHGT